MHVANHATVSIEVVQLFNIIRQVLIKHNISKIVARLDGELCRQLSVVLSRYRCQDYLERCVSKMKVCFVCDV